MQDVLIRAAQAGQTAGHAAPVGQYGRIADIQGRPAYRNGLEVRVAGFHGGWLKVVGTREWAVVATSAADTPHVPVEELVKVADGVRLVG